MTNGETAEGSIFRGRVNPLDPEYAEGAANSARHFAEAIQEARVGATVEDIALAALSNHRPGELYDPFTDAALIDALLDSKP